MTEDPGPSGSAGPYASVDRARQRLAALSQRAVNERRRAARAAELASVFEARREVAAASFRPLLSRMIKLHRLLEVRHLEAARLQECYASRLEGWAGRTDEPTAVPTFIDAVASAIGTKSAGVCLVGEDGAESLVAPSDHIARLAHDVEFVTGEGPAHDVAATMGTVRVDDSELTIRWPRFGAVVADLGVGSLISVPCGKSPADVWER